MKCLHSLFALLSLCTPLTMVKGEEKGLTVLIGGDEIMMSYEAVAALDAFEFPLHQPPYFENAKLKAVKLEALWDAVEGADAYDTLLAWCWDGYLSAYSRDFSREKEPFVIVEINGQKPSAWKDAFEVDPGPYFFSFDDAAHPDVLGSGHKMPWGVTRVEFANYEERMAPFYTGKFSDLSAEGQLGRTYWVASCMSCHPGPGGSLGGTRGASRPYEILAAFAIHSPDYFVKYSLDPKSVNPEAKMSAITEFDDSQLRVIATFMRESVVGR